MNEELIIAPLNQITQAQSQNVAQMALLVQQMSSALALLNQRITALEKSASQKVTISSKQAKGLRCRIQIRARQICDKYELSYVDDGTVFRRAILRDLMRQYGIEDLHDLPLAYLDMGGTFIDSWSSFQLVKKVREKREAVK